MRRIILLCLFCVVVSSAEIYAQPYAGPYVGQAVNMFQSPVSPGDPAQRQLESDIAVNAFDPGQIVGVAIDYRIANITGESWCAYTFSNDGGKNFRNKLFQGNPVQGPTNHPLYGLKACGDPVIAAGMIPSGNSYIGKYFFGGLAFTRGGLRKVFVTRLSAPQDGSMPSEEFTTIVDTSSASGIGGATDKPAILFVPPGMPGTPSNGNGVVHFTYVGFNGIDATNSQVFYVRSTDNGTTFSKPIALDGNIGVANGTTIAVAPDGTLYVGFRGDADWDGIWIVRSTDGGMSWTKPIRVSPAASFFGYDQPELPTKKSPQFVAARAEGFPALAVTRQGTLIMAWSEFVDTSSPASPTYGLPAAPATKSGNPIPGVTPRIVVSISNTKGDTWLLRKAAEVGPPDAYQIFPKLTVGGNWAYLFFMDARNVLKPGEPGYPPNGQGRALDFVPEFAGSYMTGVDRKIHTRIAQVDLGAGLTGLPVWNASKQVTQYLRSTSDRLDGTGMIIQRADPLTGLPSGLPADDLLNAPNFSSAVPFIGDYNSMVPAVQFKASTTHAGFDLALDATDVAARTVYVDYVSTQNVQLPNIGKSSDPTSWWLKPSNWAPYNPDPANCINPGTRNTDVYFNVVSEGVVARWSGTSAKLMDATKGSPIPQEFVLQVDNNSERDRYVKLTLMEPPGEIWSFLQGFSSSGQPLHQLIVETQILKNSSATRGVYRRNSDLSNPIGVDVKVEEIDGLTGPVHGPSMVIPGGLTTFMSYRVSPVQTPAGTLHKISAGDPSPSFIQNNPQTSKFGYSNSQFENSQFENSQFENSQFENSPTQDVIIPISNAGSVATATNVTSTLNNGQDLLQQNFDFQLLLFGTHSYPTAKIDCTASEIKRDTLISNILVSGPNTSQFENKQIGNSQFENSQFENSQFENSQFENNPIGDAQISNASLFVGSNQTNYFVLRSYEPKKGNGLLDDSTVKSAVTATTPIYDPNDPNEIAQVTQAQQLNPGETVRTATFRDFTPPAITPFVNPTPNAAGWNGAAKQPVTVYFTVNDPGSGVASQTLSRNDTGFVSNNCSTPIVFSNETPLAGITVRCDATNGAGFSSFATVTVKIDKTNPTVTFGPTMPVPNAAGWNNTLPVTVEFFPADNLSGIALTIPSVHPLTFGSETAGASIPVTAIDTADNQATFNSQVVRIDVTRPTSTITFPTNGSFNNLNGWESGCGTPAGDICGMSTDNLSGVQKVDVSIKQVDTGLYWNGTSFSSPTEMFFTATGTAPWSLAFPIANFATDGSYMVHAQATDVAGNLEASPMAGFIIDRTPPDTMITAFPPTFTNNTTAIFSFTGTDNISAPGSLTFQCSLDGAAFTACTSPVTYMGLTEASHNFRVRAIDQAANTDTTPATYSWTVDVTAPDTNITAGPSDGSTITTNSATFEFNGTDASGVASFECQLDGAGFSSCTSPKTYTALTDGLHTFQVRAIDVAGNTDATPATRSFTVSTSSIAGNALSFDGIGTFVNIPDAASLSLSTTFTVEAWVKIDSPDFARMPFISKGTDFGNYSLSVLGSQTAATPGTVEYAQKMASGNFSCCGNSLLLTFGQWTHVAATVNGPSVRVYINGALAGSFPDAPIPITNNAALFLGRIIFSGGTNQWLHGLLDEVRIWNVARTAAEISANYNHKVDPGSPGLAAYWKFDESITDQTVVDSSPSGNNGTLGADSSVASDDPTRIASTAPILP